MAEGAGGDEPSDTWAKLGLKLANQIGVMGAVAVVAGFIVLWKLPEIIRAWNEAVDSWHKRKQERGNVEHERQLARDRLDAEIRLGEARLHMSDERAPDDTQGEQHAG